MLYHSSCLILYIAITRLKISKSYDNEVLMNPTTIFFYELTVSLIKCCNLLLS